jgi:hypothetical protein
MALCHFGASLPAHAVFLCAFWPEEAAYARQRYSDSALQRGFCPNFVLPVDFDKK